MKKKLLLGLCALGSFALPAHALAPAAPVTQSRVLGGDFANEYDHGYYDGFDDATANKCNFRSSPAGTYENWYWAARQMAWDYMLQAQNTGNAEMYDFWFGYWSGLESGYYTQVGPCGSGGPGGGGGPIEEPTYTGG